MEDADVVNVPTPMSSVDEGHDTFLRFFTERVEESRKMDNDLVDVLRTST